MKETEYLVPVVVGCSSKVETGHSFVYTGGSKTLGHLLGQSSPWWDQ